MNIFHITPNDVKRVLIIGPVASCKSLTAIAGIRCIMRQRFTVVNFLPSNVYQSNDGKTSNRDGLSHPATEFINLSSALEIVIENKYEVVVIEEAQFIVDLEEFLNEMTIRGIHVFMTALNADYMGRPWPEIAVIFHTCTIQQTLGTCFVCTAPANMSLKTREVKGLSEYNPVAVDTDKKPDLDTFRPVCLICHKREIKKQIN